MKNFIRILYAVIGVVLLVFGIMTLCFVNADFGVILTPIIGLGLLLYSIFYNIITCSHIRIIKIFRYTAIGLLCICVIASCALHIYGTHDNITYNEDALIILGAGIHGEEPSLILQYRLNAALEYIAINPDVTIVVSGGQGPQENITEALAMEKYLVKNGVNPEKILKEVNASSTYENFKFSKILLNDYFENEIYTVAAITNNFHIFRAVRLADMNGMNITHYHAEIPWYTTLATYLRELAAVTKMYLLRN